MFPQAIKGREGLKKFLKEFRSIFTDLNLDAEEDIAEGDIPSYIPKNVVIVSVIALGFPDEQPHEPSRESLDKITHWNEWTTKAE